MPSGDAISIRSFVTFCWVLETHKWMRNSVQPGRHVEGPYLLNSLKTEAVWSSETLVISCQTAWRYNTEDRNMKHVPYKTRELRWEKINSLFYPDGGDSTVLRNVGTFVPDNTVSYPGKLTTSHITYHHRPLHKVHQSSSRYGTTQESSLQLVTQQGQYLAIEFLFENIHRTILKDNIKLLNFCLKENVGYCYYWIAEQSTTESKKRGSNVVCCGSYRNSHYGSWGIPFPSFAITSGRTIISLCRAPQT